MAELYEQASHLYGFSLVWTLRCLVRSDFVLKEEEHPSSSVIPEAARGMKKIATTLKRRRSIVFAFPFKNGFLEPPNSISLPFVGFKKKKKSTDASFILHLWETKYRGGNHARQKSLSWYLNEMRQSILFRSCDIVFSLSDFKSSYNFSRLSPFPGFVNPFSFPPLHQIMLQYSTVGREREVKSAI